MRHSKFYYYIEYLEYALCWFRFYNPQRQFWSYMVSSLLPTSYKTEKFLINIIYSLLVIFILLHTIAYCFWFTSRPCFFFDAAPSNLLSDAYVLPKCLTRQANKTLILKKSDFQFCKTYFLYIFCLIYTDSINDILNIR